jgi:hypothetical protein
MVKRRGRDQKKRKNYEKQAECTADQVASRIRVGETSRILFNLCKVMLRRFAKISNLKDMVARQTWSSMIPAKLNWAIVSGAEPCQNDIEHTFQFEFGMDVQNLKAKSSRGRFLEVLKL